MSATQDVEYDYEGRKVKFTIQRLKWRDYQRIVSDAGKMQLQGSRTIGNLDTIKMADELMRASVTCADKVDFHDLDIASGIDLQNKVMEFNGLGGPEKPFPAP